jgi:hypothetical protein
MNKIFKYSLALLVLTAGFVACSDDDDNYQAATVSGPQVFFDYTLKSKIEISNTASSFTIPVSRGDKSGTLSVPLQVTSSEGSIFSVPTSISFADGAEKADLVVTYDPANIVYGKYDTITVALADASQATAYGLNSYTFTAGITEWVKMKGKATYRDDMLTGLWTSLPISSWTVDIYESAITPGRYMLEAPYGPKTDFRYTPLWDDENELLKYFVDNGNLNMVIDATDPNYVYFEQFDTGIKDILSGDNQGMIGLTSYVWYWLQNGNPLETVKAARASYFGKLEDGVISFPEPKTLLVTLDGDLGWYGNPNGQTAIALPGYTFADFSAEVAYAGIFTNPAEEVFAMGTLTLGPDAQEVKAVVVPGDADVSAVADAIASGDLEATSVQAGTIQVPVDGQTGELQIVVVVLNKGEVKTIAAAGFEYYGGGNSNPWKTLGTGYYVDDLVVPLYTKAELPYGPYEVEVKVNDEMPGVYRLVSLYAPVAAYFEEKGGEKDILVNAEEADCVYITDQPIGLDFGLGDMSIMSEGGYYVAKYGMDVVKGAIAGGQIPAEIFGTLKDGVITFPTLQEESSSGAMVSYQLWLNMGGSSYFGGMNEAVKIVLPGAKAEVKAKARKLAAAASFARRLGITSFKGVSVKRHMNKNLVKAKMVK